MLESDDDPRSGVRLTGRHRNPLDWIADRSRSEAASAAGAAWAAFMVGLLVGGDLQDAGSRAVASLIGLAVVFLGFAAASGCRTLPRNRVAKRPQLAFCSLAAGAVLGLANLGSNMAIAATHPELRALLAARMVMLEPIRGLVAAPLVEEVVVRLFLMSALAWVVARFTRRTTPVFAVALVGSAFVFAALHLDRPMPADPALAAYYRGALLAKYTLAGLPLGWIFWRWGLPYSIVCHAAANAAHLAAQGRVF